MQRLPAICPDTSVHNRMMKDGLESEAIFAALKSGYHVRLLGLSIEELLATPDTATRQALMAAAGRLQHGQSDCLYPHNEILRRHCCSRTRPAEVSLAGRQRDFLGLLGRCG